MKRKFFCHGCMIEFEIVVPVKDGQDETEAEAFLEKITAINVPCPSCCEDVDLIGA